MGRVKMKLKAFMICLTGLVALCLPGGTLAADNGKCVYPSQGGMSPDSSPPTAQGKIIRITANAIILKLESSSTPDASQKIRVDKKTRIFDFSGAIVDKNLVSGRKAYVWYKDCQLPQKGKLPYAAVVKIDTKPPNKK
jgi:hypothetical protein